MRWFLRLSLKKFLSPARQFPHRAAGTLAPCIVCGSRVGMTAAGVNGEPVHLGNGSKRVLDALFEEQSDERCACSTTPSLHLTSFHSVHLRYALFLHPSI
jgi:hypothetical protein